MRFWGGREKKWGLEVLGVFGGFLGFGVWASDCGIGEVERLLAMG